MKDADSDLTQNPNAALLMVLELAPYGSLKELLVVDGRNQFKRLPFPEHERVCLEMAQSVQAVLSSFWPVS